MSCDNIEVIGELVKGNYRKAFQKWMIADLKGVIENIKDDHDSIPGTFTAIEGLLTKWKTAWKQEESIREK
jgi:hypothetical protein